eukprot:6681165-Pyramimonas_sp.AAC.1
MPPQREEGGEGLPPQAREGEGRGPTGGGPQPAAQVLAAAAAEPQLLRRARHLHLALLPCALLRAAQGAKRDAKRIAPASPYGCASRVSLARRQVLPAATCARGLVPCRPPRSGRSPSSFEDSKSLDRFSGTTCRRRRLYLGTGGGGTGVCAAYVDPRGAGDHHRSDRGDGERAAVPLRAAH